MILELKRIAKLRKQIAHSHISDESQFATLPEHLEGYLAHNLEHGHVIFWYNCNLLTRRIDAPRFPLAKPTTL
jgi:hypothetical protein